MLITLLLALGIGWNFYQLAKKYDDQPWHYTILGISIFFTAIYGGEFAIEQLKPLILGDYMFSFWTRNILNVSLMAIALTCSYRFYNYLKEDWSQFSEKSLSQLVHRFGKTKHSIRIED